MAYWLLACAIVVEVGATTCLKYSDGFSRLWPSLGTAAGYLAAFVLLSFALRDIPVSVAYAVWSGAGTALVAAIGVAFLGESLSGLKVAGLALVVAGVAALNVGGAH